MTGIATTAMKICSRDERSVLTPNQRRKVESYSQGAGQEGQWVENQSKDRVILC